MPKWLGHVKCHEHLTLNRGGVSCDDRTPCHICREKFDNDLTGSHKKRVTQLRKDRNQKRKKREKTLTPKKATPWEESDSQTDEGA